MTTIYDLVTELQSFVPINSRVLKAAKKSGITSDNHEYFGEQVRLWSEGAYDNDVELIAERLATLLGVECYF